MELNNSNIILCDFPWGDCYGKRTNPNTKFGLGCRGHYPTMTNQEILDFKYEIDKIAKDNCMLLQWATGPALDFAIESMKYFDFKYKTVGLVWIKTSKSGTPRILPSSYFGSNAEFLLIGIKGNTRYFRPEKKLVGQIVISGLREHSRKPDEAYNKIELAYPNLEKIEFFSRENRENWTCYGNEVGKFN